MQVNVLKPTLESWHGNYTLDGWYYGVQHQGFVEVTFCGNICTYDTTLVPVWRTCVWGNDDCGMEFDCDTEAEAWNKFLQVIGMKFVNRAELVSLGFVTA